jgi:hypothetical protein
MPAAALSCIKNMSEPDIERQIKLYGLLVDQLHKYTPILWQAPIALVGANVLALGKIQENPWLSLVLGLFDATFIFGLRKIVLRQRSLIDAAKRAEKILSGVGTLSPFIPEFKESKVRAPELIVATLWLLTFALVVWGIVQILSGLL